MGIGKGLVVGHVLTWNGSAWVSQAGSGGGGGADPNASYIVVGLTGSLPNERSLFPTNGIIGVDGGAGNPYGLSIDDSVVATVSGTTFTGDINAPNVYAATNVTGSTVFATTNVTASYAEFGIGSLSSTGEVRLTNNSAIAARNAANTQDINIASVDGSDNLIIGNTLHASTIDMDANGAVTIDSRIAGVSVGGAGASDFTTLAGALTLQGAAGVTVTSTGGTLTLDGTGQTVDLDSAVLDVDASDSIEIDTDGGISIDAMAASNVTVNLDQLALTSQGTGANTIVSAVSGSHFTYALRYAETGESYISGSGDYFINAPNLSIGTITDMSAIDIDASGSINIESKSGNVRLVSTGSQALLLGRSAGANAVVSADDLGGTFAYSVRYADFGTTFQSGSGDYFIDAPKIKLGTITDMSSLLMSGSGASTSEWGVGEFNTVRLGEDATANPNNVQDLNFYGTGRVAGAQWNVTQFATASLGASRFEIFGTDGVFLKGGAQSSAGLTDGFIVVSGSSEVTTFLSNFTGSQSIIGAINAAYSAGGGGGTPGGSNTQVQFNDGGSFGGDAGLVYNKTSDALTVAGDVTGSVLYATSNITSSYAEIGTGNLATVGDIRLTNNSSVVARNAANTQDINLISLDSSDNLHLGDGTTNPGSVTLDVQTSAIFRIAGTYELALYPTYLDVVLPSIIFRNTETSPTLKQGDDTTSTGKGESLTLQSQNLTNGAGGTGGNLKLTAGTGTTNSGDVQLSGRIISLTGSLEAPQGISGSLTQLSDGTSYLVAGSNVTVASGSNGQITISSTGGSSLTCGFQAYMSSNQNVTTSTTTVQFDSEQFDIGSDFNTTTYTFTAPSTGKYLFNVLLWLDTLQSAASYYDLTLVTSNRTYSLVSLDPQGFDQDLSFYTLQGHLLVDMDASDTALVRILQGGGVSGTTTIEPVNFGLRASLFTGYLVG